MLVEIQSHMAHALLHFLCQKEREGGRRERKIQLCSLLLARASHVLMYSKSTWLCLEPHTQSIYTMSVVLKFSVLFFTNIKHVSIPFYKCTSIQKTDLSLRQTVQFLDYSRFIPKILERNLKSFSINSELVYTGARRTCVINN